MFYQRLSHARKKDALIYDPCLLLIVLPEKAHLRFLYLDAPTLYSSIKTRLTSIFNERLSSRQRCSLLYDPFPTEKSAFNISIFRCINLVKNTLNERV